jgi:hypothetical protein
MPITFPSSPAVNDSYTSGGRTWTWTGSVWQAASAAAVAGPTGPTGAQGPTGPAATTIPQSGLTRTVNNVTTIGGTPYVTQDSDIGNIVNVSSTTSGCSVTIAGNIPVGKSIDFVQGALIYPITFSPAAGTYLYSSGGKLKTSGQYAVASVTCIAANVYLLYGDLVV